MLPSATTFSTSEMTGSYAIYKDGWKASFPNDRTKRIPESDKRIYLYNIREDFNELNDVAAKYPRRRKSLPNFLNRKRGNTTCIR